MVSISDSVPPTLSAMDTLQLCVDCILTTVAGSALRVGFRSAEATKSSAFISCTLLSSPDASLMKEPFQNCGRVVAAAAVAGAGAGWGAGTEAPDRAGAKAGWR